MSKFKKNDSVQVDDPDFYKKRYELNEFKGDDCDMIGHQTSTTIGPGSGVDSHLP